MVQPYVLQQLGTFSTAVNEYKNSHIAQHARAMRNDNNDFSGVNYATFFIRIGVNNYQVTASSDTYHSEKECWLKLCNAAPIFKNLRVRSWKEGNFGGNLTPAQLLNQHNAVITSVYTEREPCSGCSPLLEEVMPGNATVYWSFVYPSKETSKFEHTSEQTALFGLLNLGPSIFGVDYKDTVESTVREGRVIGNKQLKDSWK